MQLFGKTNRLELSSAKSEAGLTYIEVVVAMAIAVIVIGALYSALSAGLSSASNTRSALRWANELESIKRELRTTAERVQIPFWVSLPPEGREGAIDVPYIDGKEDRLLSLRWDSEHLTISDGSTTYRHAIDVLRVEPLVAEGRWAGIALKVARNTREIEILAPFGGWSLR